MSERTEALDRMTDLEAIASLEREFPGWMINRGVSGRCYGSHHASNRRDAVSGEDWVDLRDALIREMWRHHGRASL